MDFVRTPKFLPKAKRMIQLGAPQHNTPEAASSVTWIKQPLCVDIPLYKGTTRDSQAKQLLPSLWQSPTNRRHSIARPRGSIPASSNHRVSNTENVGYRLRRGIPKSPPGKRHKTRPEAALYPTTHRTALTTSSNPRQREPLPLFLSGRGPQPYPKLLPGHPCPTTRFSLPPPRHEGTLPHRPIRRRFLPGPPLSGRS